MSLRSRQLHHRMSNARLAQNRKHPSLLPSTDVFRDSYMTEDRVQHDCFRAKCSCGWVSAEPYDTMLAASDAAIAHTVEAHR